MKTAILFILMFATTLTTSAQLFKKLKEKTQKVLESKSETASSNSQSNPSEENDRAPETKKATPPPENGNVVFSLAADESLLYDESRILTKNKKLSYSFVVQNKKYEYFLIEDGNRSGPFKEAPVKSMQETDESSSGSNSDEVSMGDKKDPVAIQYSKTISGKLYLVFNGKNYGPYDHVSKMIVSPDKKQFFALVTIGGENSMTVKMGMGFSFMVNETALKQKAGAGGLSVPLKFSVSDGFKHCMVTLMDQKDQKIISVTSAGKQEEGSMADMYSGGSNNSFVNDNGDIITIPAQSPTQVLVNGKEVASFKVPITSVNRLFLTSDLSKSVYYENGKIYRADGTEESLSGVLFPKITTVNNETAVYYFKMYKNDSGAKDVYLCKKVI